MIDSISLNAVRGAAACVADDTDGTAVAALVANIASAAADAWAALAGAVVDTAVVAADARAALAGAAADTAFAAADVAAAADSACDFYRRAASATIAASASPALPAASGFETSGLGMAAVGPVQAPVELFRADETTLQVAQTKFCFQSKIPFLGSIRRGEAIQDSTASILFGYLSIVILYVEH